MDKLKNGLSDKKTLRDLVLKHTKKGSKGEMLRHLETQLSMGTKVETEHTNNKSTAKEIAMDHLWEDPNYYTKLKKIETKESTGADSAGAFEPAFGSTPIKRKITVIHNLKEEESDIDEATDASSSGAYDAPFGGGGKNPLKIGGENSIKQSRAVKDKNFPKWGGPKGVFIKIKEKCKKFPYCNQGDINALNIFENQTLKNVISNLSHKYELHEDFLKEIIFNEISKIENR